MNNILIIIRYLSECPQLLLDSETEQWFGEEAEWLTPGEDEATGQTVGADPGGEH